ncbi:MAG: ChaN family lipoprotein [Desulfuromonadales bacterium]
MMTIRKRSVHFLWAFTLFILTACTMTQAPIGNPEAPYPPRDVVVGDIYHLPTGVKVSAEEMLAAISDARIVYVGETHDNPAAHRLQLKILKDMVARYPGQVSLGMEMFNRSQQEVLDRWVTGMLDEKTFLKDVDWYGTWKMDFAYYADILHFARDAGIPVIGLNATQEMVRALGRQTPEELDPQTRSQLPEFDFDDPYQTAMTQAIYADHTQGESMLAGFQRIQTLWDETMAESITRHLQAKGPNQRMVVLAGGNHIRYGFGIPRRVFRRLPTSYVLVGVREIDLPKDKQDGLMDVEMPPFPMPPYDYLVYTAYESLDSKRVKLGVHMKEENGRVVVEAVVPQSAADLAGVRQGDVIVALGETEIADMFDLIYAVRQYASGDQSVMIVERDQTPITLNVTFTPMPEADRKVHPQE